MPRSLQSLRCRGNSQFSLYYSCDDIIELQLCGHCKRNRERKSLQHNFYVVSSMLRQQLAQVAYYTSLADQTLTPISGKNI